MVETTTLVLSPSGTFSTEKSEIHVLVIASGDDFILAERENGPDADLFTDDIAVLDLDVEDFRRGRCIQACKGGDLVTDDQEQLHPQRMMRENGEEDIDDGKVPAAQRRPVGSRKYACSMTSQLNMLPDGTSNSTTFMQNSEHPNYPNARLRYARASFSTAVPWAVKRRPGQM